MTTALQSIHIKYALYCLACLEMSNSPFSSPPCISLYKEIGDPGICMTEGRGRQAKKGKKYVEMKLAHVQRPKGECPVEMNCESRANRAVCLVPSAHRVASEDNYHRLIRSTNLLGTLTSWAASGSLPAGKTERALWLLRKENQLGIIGLLRNLTATLCGGPSHRDCWEKTTGSSNGLTYCDQAALVPKSLDCYHKPGTGLYSKALQKEPVWLALL